jgi:hypothetical protein
VGELYRNKQTYYNFSMKHTTRMLLIPEDVYLQLIGSVSDVPISSKVKIQSSQKDKKKPSLRRLKNKTPLLRASPQPYLSAAPEDPLIQQSLQNLSSSTSSPRRRSTSGGDDADDAYARNVYYQQEFRRMQKLREDRDERPVRVTFSNSRDYIRGAEKGGKPEVKHQQQRRKRPRKKEDSIPTSSSMSHEYYGNTSAAATSENSDDNSEGVGEQRQQ